MEKLLIVDDELPVRNSLSFALEDGYEIFTAEDGISAVEIISDTDISIVLLDLRLGNEDGISVLKNIKARRPEIAVLIMTAYGTIESSVEAIKAGAFYYITKPINIDELMLLLEKTKEYLALNNRIKYLSSQICQNGSLYNIVGTSKKIQKVFDLIDKVKDIDSNVLITGESGTGKELVARAMHFEGKRKSRPFNIINCSAMPANLLESELFGFKKGSFTGAFEDRKGIIELSDGGTLFLDEIGDMDINLQVKLLRVLQNKEVRPIGMANAVKFDVRFISATNKDLKEEIKNNLFRKDLFYRLNVININLPSLRERREDISKLVGYFIKKYNALLDKNIKGIDSEALEALEKYRFEGNVRELENIIERATALSREDFIGLKDLPEELFSQENMVVLPDDIMEIYAGDSMKTIEKKAIQHTLRKFGSNRKKTAEILGISERSLRYKIKEYNL
jgi:DNA-binding NtrC family response regulator